MRSFLFAFFLISVVPFSAKSNIDSLKQELKTASSDSLKYSILENISWGYENLNHDSTFHYYLKAAEVSKKNDWHRKTGNVYYNMGMHTHYSLRSDSCFLLLNKAEEYYTMADYKLGVLNCTFTEGTFWVNFEKLDSAIFYLEKAVVYGQEINDTTYLHKIYNNLGLAYQYTGQIDEATKYMLLSIQEKEKYSPNDIASAYINLGVHYLNTNNSQESIKYSQKGYDESLKSGYLLGAGLSLKNIGDAFDQDNLLDSTLYYYKRAKNVFLDINDSNHLSRYYMSTSEVFEAQGLFDQAADSMQMAMEYFPSNGSSRLRVHILTRQCVFKMDKEPSRKALKEIEVMALEANHIAQESGLEIDVSKTAKILFYVYSRLNNNDLAMEYATSYIDIQDSLFNEQQAEALAEQRTKFETEKKEIEINLLNKENQLKSTEIERNEELQGKQQTIIYLMIVGFIVTIIFIGIVLKLNSKQKSTNIDLKEKNQLIKKQNSEKETLLKEIHHRVKNNLQIVWSLLDLQSNSITDEKIKLAINDGKNRINSMAMIHQMLYQNDDAGNIFFKDYLNKLIHQIRSTFEGAESTQIKLDIPESLRFDIDTSIPIGLIVTELITNAFKYAFDDFGTGVIELKLKEEGAERFKLCIIDNGKGLPQDYDISKSKSLGLRLVKNLSKQVKGKMTVKSENGTHFMIDFKGETFKLV